jgi:hypothetical protein
MNEQQILRICDGLSSKSDGRYEMDTTSKESELSSRQSSETYTYSQKYNKNFLHSLVIASAATRESRLEN